MLRSAERVSKHAERLRRGASFETPAKSAGPQDDAGLFVWFVWFVVEIFPYAAALWSGCFT